MNMQKFGEFLIVNNIINRNELMNILRKHRNSGLKIGEVLVREGVFEEDKLISLLGEYLNIKTATMEEVQVLPEFVGKISEKIGLRYRIIPVKFKDRNGIYLSSSELIPNSIIENLIRIFKIPIKPLLMSRKDNEILLKNIYNKQVEEENYDDEEDYEIIDTEEAVDIVDNMILKALSQNASDIHIEPYEDEVKVRFRIDGILMTVDVLNKSVAESVISRIKVLSNMNIADKRNPQDGGFKFEKNGGKKVSINLRVSTLPCVKGEKMALRIMPTEENILSFEQLGMDEKTVDDFKSILEYPHGIIFVTGPTGSGKSNTLYTALKSLRSDEINITTVEDPVELQIKGINQTQTDNGNRFTFSKALKTILRQDPNIIMVGEVRDVETAGLALESALTGHLVLSTLHTNDSTSALGRLIDMGCEPFLVTSSIRAVLAQRLVRVICPACKESYEPTQEELRSVGMSNRDNIKFYRGRGCQLCSNTGYRGRTGMFELFILDLETQKLIGRGIEPNTLRDYAIKNGMRTLRDDGLIKLEKGITTVTEVLKATME